MIMTQEEKAKRYDEAIERARAFNNGEDCNIEVGTTLCEYIFPELKERKDERIREALIALLKFGLKDGSAIAPGFNETKEQALAWLEKQGEEPNWCHHKVDLSNCSEEYRKAYYDGWNNCNMQYSQCKSDGNDVVKCLINGMKFYYEGNEEATWGTQKFSMKVKDILSWLEKQGKETSWKPSKEEMDVLYGLAYITNKYDEHKEEVITRLYQDLKREFFNGSSYENMFPNTEDGVRRRSTIQVLEYVKSLDNYNQYGKADIDKNIAWLEKQGKKPQGKSALEAIQEEKADNANKIEPKDYSSIDPHFGKPIGKVEPKFKDGDWITNGEYTWKVISVDYLDYTLQNQWGECVEDTVDYVNKAFHLWTIQDAKDGDVLAFDNGTIVIFKDLYNSTSFHSYCHIECGIFDFNKDELPDWWEGEGFNPSTKEQSDILFQKMKEAGYEWDADKKELRKEEVK